MKFSLFTFLLFATSTSLAQGYGLLGANFAAPTIDGKEHVSLPTTGEIIFDTTDGAFWGKTDVVGAWVKLSGNATTDGNPIGTVLTFAAENCPDGYVSADGASLNRNGTYAALFGVIGTAHGTADSDHFNVPNYKGRILRGWANGSSLDPDRTGRPEMAPGGVTGDRVGSIQGDAYASHSHFQTYNASPGALSSGYTFNTSSNQAGATAATNQTLPSGTSTETRPKNAYVNYCIKY